MVDQYNVVFKYDSERGLIDIMMQSQQVLPFDNSGNAQRWTFSREELKYGGNSVVLKTLDRSTAYLAYDRLSQLEGIVAQEPVVCEWERPLRE